MAVALEIRDGNPWWYLSTDLWVVPGDDPDGTPGPPVAGSPALQQILARMQDLDRILPDQGGVAPGLIGGAVSRVEQAVQVVLSPVF